MSPRSIVLESRGPNEKAAVRLGSGESRTGTRQDKMAFRLLLGR